MRRSARRTALAGLAALALAVNAVGLCHCLASAGACHGEAPERDAHACCEKPAGVQAVAHACCDEAPELALASTDVPEVAPPALNGDQAATASRIEWALLVDATHAPLPHPPDRTTVLLI
jgi:hypothetical protein